MAGPVVMNVYLDAAQVYRVVAVIGHIGRRLALRRQLDLEILLTDDLGSGVEELLDVAAVVRVDVSDHHVTDRKLGHGPDLLHKRLIELLAGILSVDQDQAVGGNADAGVPPGTRAGDDVITRLYQANLLRQRGFSLLGVLLRVEKGNHPYREKRDGIEDVRPQSHRVRT